MNVVSRGVIKHQPTQAGLMEALAKSVGGKLLPKKNLGLAEAVLSGVKFGAVWALGAALGTAEAVP
jgi:hypothetical protein